MYKLVLSTPRSGSHFYSESLDGNVIHEMLSRCNCNQYLEDKDENIQHMTNLEEEAVPINSQYYQNLVDGNIVKIYEKRDNKKDFFNSFMSEITKPSTNYVVHEHISLLPDEWLKQLIDNSKEAHYLKRNNIREQIASRIIAGYTGVYVVRNNGSMLCHGNITNINSYDHQKFYNEIASVDLIKYLISMYRRVDNTVKKFDKVKIVYYEDLMNEHTKTKKLFPSSFDRLCDADQHTINSLLN
jgi:hypothetical protein